MRDYKELIEALRSFANSYVQMFGKGESSQLMDEAADAIEELQKRVDVEKAFSGVWEENANECRSRFQKLLDAFPKWISVEERLPDVKKEVIVCDKMPNGMRYVTTAFMLEDCAFLNDCGRMYEVTHWMPLPEPPKEADNA